MRPLLLAGSSLLALSALVATASAGTVTFINSSPSLETAPTGFVQNDVLVNPDGLFNGRLQGDGNFVVSYGPTPNNSLLWSAGFSNASNGPYGLSIYRGNTKLFGTSLTSYYVYKNGNPSTSFYELAGSNYYNAATFLRLNDNGSLSIYPGTNGVATGSPITTVGAPTATYKDLTLTSIQYDLADATFPEVDQIFGATHELTNTTPSIATLTAHLSMTYADTQTYNWNNSGTVTIGMETKTAVNFPIIGASEFTMSVSGSTTISKGGSNSSGMETTYSSDVSVPVPSGATYGVQMFATKQDATVPYTYTGFYNYSTGVSVPTNGSGTFDGVSTGIFDADVYCISPASICNNSVGEIVPAPPTVPEPSSLAMLLPGVLTLGTALALRKRSNG